MFIIPFYAIPPRKPTKPAHTPSPGLMENTAASNSDAENVRVPVS
jgi:hypothetical protein